VCSVHSDAFTHKLVGDESNGAESDYVVPILSGGEGIIIIKGRSTTSI
jgi:hypothetical protein